MLNCLVVALGGGIGACLRYLTGLFIKTGLCGGFTTFSTFALETEALIKAGHIGFAVVYVVLSVVVGVGLAFAGQVVVGK